MKARPIAYFDTSVLVKRYVEEVSSDRARMLMRRFTIVSSAVALVEITSALVRRRAAGGITDEQLELALGILQRDRQHWTVLSLTEAVLKRAEEVVRHTVMRSLDALHVASAMGLQEELATALPFITADGMQEAGARRVGLEVLVVA